MKPLVIVGTGNGGRIALDVALALRVTVEGFVAQPGAARAPINGASVLGDDDLLTEPGFIEAHSFVVPIGPNADRRRISLQLLNAGAELATLIHPTCSVSSFATIGEGSVLAAGVIVNCNAQIGRFCIVNVAATIEHDSVLEDGVLISPGVHFGGRTYCAEGSFVGIGACTKAGVRIGANAIVGAGAVVLRDVPDNAVVVGNPAKPLPQKEPVETGGSSRDY